MYRTKRCPKRTHNASDVTGWLLPQRRPYTRAHVVIDRQTAVMLNFRFAFRRHNYVLSN